MRKITIDDLVNELDKALQLAIELGKPTAMIQATLGKAKLLGLDRADSHLDSEPQPVKIVIQTVDARKPDRVC